MTDDGKGVATGGVLLVGSVPLGSADEVFQLAATERIVVGFRPLEELHGLWAAGNPCLIMVRCVEDPLPRR